MESARWLVLSPLMVALAAGALAPGRLGSALAGDAAWDPPPCTVAGGAPPGASTTWYRLDTVLDRTGTLAARRLVLGIAGEPSKGLDLAPESFASGPVAGLVLVGEDDGSTSRLRLIDAARGCATDVAAESQVIRSAVLAGDARSLYEHRVDRATRADLGVWRRTIGGASVRVLEGLAPDPRLGPTFVTDLVLADDGRLAVSSCTPAGCRVRVLDPATSTVLPLADTGPAVGLTGGQLVVRPACTGLPCPVEAVSLATGRRTTLVDDAYAATLAGGRLVYETADGRVGAIEVATGRRTAPVPAAGVPMRSGSTATAGAAAAPGGVILAPDGRPAASTLRHYDPATGTVASRVEATR